MWGMCFCEYNVKAKHRPLNATMLLFCVTLFYQYCSLHSDINWKSGVSMHVRNKQFWPLEIQNSDDVWVIGNRRLNLNKIALINIFCEFRYKVCNFSTKFCGCSIKYRKKSIFTRPLHLSVLSYQTGRNNQPIAQFKFQLDRNGIGWFSIVN